MNQYRSKKFIAKQGTKDLKVLLQKYLRDHKFVYCKSLKNRKIFLEKLPEAITARKDCKYRLQAFWVGVDILQKSRLKPKIKRNDKKIIEYEFQGLFADGKKVKIHVREELVKKDKKIFLTSTYYVQKKAPSPSKRGTEPVDYFFLLGTFMPTRATQEQYRSVFTVYTKMFDYVKLRWKLNVNFFFISNFYFCRLFILCGFFITQALLKNKVHKIHILNL